MTDASADRVDRILCAVGRVPTVESLGLDSAGVTTTAQGIPVNDLLQTNQSHIYAVGDVTGGPAFTHYAGHQAAHAVRNIFVPIKAKFSPGHLPWVTFTDPEIAHVGRTEAEARAAGDTCQIVRFPYSHNERAVTDAEPVGLMKFLIDGKRRLIGAHIAGHCAGELINELTLAMNNDLTIDAIISSIHTYPTYSFAIPIALYDYALTENPSTAAKVGRFLSRLTQASHLTLVVIISRPWLTTTSSVCALPCSGCASPCTTPSPGPSSSDGSGYRNWPRGRTTGGTPPTPCEHWRTTGLAS
ncbi:MAG: FAD-dependent oxidoreductase [Pseudonocardiaceae bacterium]